MAKQTSYDREDAVSQPSLSLDAPDLDFVWDEGEVVPPPPTSGPLPLPLQTRPETAEQPQQPQIPVVPMVRWGRMARPPRPQSPPAMIAPDLDLRTDQQRLQEAVDERNPEQSPLAQALPQDPLRGQRLPDQPKPTPGAPYPLANPDQVYVPFSTENFRMQQAVRRYMAETEEMVQRQFQLPDETWETRQAFRQNLPFEGFTYRHYNENVNWNDVEEGRKAVQSFLTDDLPWLKKNSPEKYRQVVDHIQRYYNETSEPSGQDLYRIFAGKLVHSLDDPEKLQEPLSGTELRLWRMVAKPGAKGIYGNVNPQTSPLARFNILANMLARARAGAGSSDTAWENMHDARRIAFVNGELMRMGVPTLVEQEEANAIGQISTEDIRQELSSAFGLLPRGTNVASAQTPDWAIEAAGTMYDTIYGSAANIASNVDPDIGNRFREARERTPRVEGFAGDLLSGVTSVGQSLVVGFLTGGAGVGAFYVAEGTGRARSEAARNKLTGGEEAALMAFYGAAGSLETLPFAKLMGVAKGGKMAPIAQFLVKKFGNRPVGQITGAMIEQAFTEGGQEAMQALIDTLGEEAVGINDKQLREVLSQALYEGSIGAIVGLLTAGGFGSSAQIQQRWARASAREREQMIRQAQRVREEMIEQNLLERDDGGASFLADMQKAEDAAVLGVRTFETPETETMAFDVDPGARVQQDELDRTFGDIQAATERAQRDETETPTIEAEREGTPPTEVAEEAGAEAAPRPQAPVEVTGEDVARHLEEGGRLNVQAIMDQFGIDRKQANKAIRAYAQRRQQGQRQQLTPEQFEQRAREGAGQFVEPQGPVDVTAGLPRQTPEQQAAQKIVDESPHLKGSTVVRRDDGGFELRTPNNRRVGMRMVTPQQLDDLRQNTSEKRKKETGTRVGAKAAFVRKGFRLNGVTYRPGDLLLTEDASPSSVAHELGHWIEFHKLATNAEIDAVVEHGKELGIDKRYGVTDRSEIFALTLQHHKDVKGEPKSVVQKVIDALRALMGPTNAQKFLERFDRAEFTQAKESPRGATQAQTPVTKGPQAATGADTSSRAQTKKKAKPTKLSKPKADESQVTGGERQVTQEKLPKAKAKESKVAQEDTSTPPAQTDKSDQLTTESKGKVSDVASPFLRQWQSLKEKHPDVLLLMKIGDFYETFGDDARTMHQVTGVTLTQAPDGTPRAGVPYRTVEGYLRRLIAAGHRVALADQVDDAKGADVERVVTPGKLVEEAEAQQAGEPDTTAEEGEPQQPEVVEQPAPAAPKAKLDDIKFEVPEQDISEQQKRIKEIESRRANIANAQRQLRQTMMAREEAINEQPELVARIKEEQKGIKGTGMKRNRALVQDRLRSEAYRNDEQWRAAERAHTKYEKEYYELREEEDKLEAEVSRAAENAIPQARQQYRQAVEQFPWYEIEAYLERAFPAGRPNEGDRIAKYETLQEVLRDKIAAQGLTAEQLAQEELPANFKEGFIPSTTRTARPSGRKPMAADAAGVRALGGDLARLEEQSKQPVQGQAATLLDPKSGKDAARLTEASDMMRSRLATLSLSKLKQFIDEVAEFAVDPAFTVRLPEGGDVRLVFQDGGRYSFVPEGIGIILPVDKDGTVTFNDGDRIGIDIDAVKRAKKNELLLVTKGETAPVEMTEAERKKALQDVAKDAEWAKQSITIDEQSVEAEVYRGMAVHERPADRGGKRWHVTHVKSGEYAGTFGNKTDAKVAAYRLADMGLGEIEAKMLEAMPGQYRMAMREVSADAYVEVELDTAVEEATSPVRTLEGKLKAIEDAARERLRNTKLKGKGRYKGGTTLGTDLTNVGIIAGARIARLGVKGFKKAMKVVQQVAQEVGITMDQAAARRVTWLARKLARDTGGDPDKFDQMAQDFQNRAMAREERQATKATLTRQTREQVKETTGQAKDEFDQPTVTPRQALLYAMKKASRYARQAYRQGQLDLSATHKELVNFANRVLPKDQVGRLSKAIAKVRTDREREQLIRAVNVLHAQNQHKAAIDAFKTAKKELSPLRMLRPQFRKQAEALLSTVDMTTPTDTLLRRFQSLVSYLDQDPDAMVPRAEVERARAALDKWTGVVEGRTFVLKDMDTQDIQALANALAAIKKQNDLMNKLVFGKRQRDRAAVDQEAADGVRSRWQRVSRGGDPGVWERDRGSSLPIRMMGMLANYDTTVFGLVGEEGEAHNVLFENLKDGNRVTTGVVARFTEAMRPVFEKHGVTSDVLAKMSDAYLKPGAVQSLLKRMMGEVVSNAESRAVVLPKSRYKSTNKRITELQVTSGEMVYLLASIMDSDTRQEMLRAGITFDRGKVRRAITLSRDDLQAIRDAATDVERDIAEAFHAFLNGPLKDLLNEAWVKNRGYEIATRDDYFPRRRDPESMPKELDKALQEFGDLLYDSYGIFKDRAKDKAPLLMGDAFATMVDHVGKVATYVGKHSAALDAMSIVQPSSQFAQAVLESPRGDVKLRQIRDTIKKWGTIRRAELSPVDELTRRFMRNAHKGILGAKPHIMAYQPISYLLAGTAMPPVYLAEVFQSGENLGDRKQIEAELEQYAPELHGRLVSGAHDIINPANLRHMMSVTLMGEERRDWTDFPLRGISMMDHMTIRQIYRACKLWVKADGLTGEAALKEAAKRASRVVDKTQPTWDELTRSGVSQWAADTPVAALLTMFTSQTSKNYNVALRSVYEFRQSNQTAEDYKRLVTKFGMSTIIQSALVYAIGTLARMVYGLGEPQKERKTFTDHAWNTLMRTLGNLQVVGSPLASALETVKRSMEGKRNFGQGVRTGNVAYDTLNDVTVMTQEWAKAVDQAFKGDDFVSGPNKGKRKWEVHFQRALDKSLTPAGTLLGLPLSGIEQVTRGMRKKLWDQKHNTTYYYDMIEDSRKWGDDREAYARKKLHEMGVEDDHIDDVLNRRTQPKSLGWKVRDGKTFVITGVESAEDRALLRRLGGARLPDGSWVFRHGKANKVKEALGERIPRRPSKPKRPSRKQTRTLEPAN